MRVILANPRGFCAGVYRAIEIVERALELFHPPIYVRHEVVHNRFVVDGLRRRGAVFVDRLADVPDDAIVIFSAHGVPKSVQEEAVARDLKVFDATCPLVTKVHMEVTRHSREGRECILIGHAGHPEVEGTLGQYLGDRGGMYLVETPDDVERLWVKNAQDLAFVTQTTLSMDDAALIISALHRRFSGIRGPRKDDICFATQHRQEAVKALVRCCDMILVVGSSNSSNSNRLKELAERRGTPAYLVDNADEIRRSWLEAKESIGLTAGASAPEVLVAGVLERLKSWGCSGIQENTGEYEKLVFPLPKPLQRNPRVG
jgi:4-hydroxy-3-methylbut-2-enyl diphosphate reductase